MSPYRIRRNGHVFYLPPLDHASWRFNAHPDGTGTAWEEDVDVDRPHGLDYRYINHVAKAVRKRAEKEHATFGDTTAGGEHIPGGCQVLLRDTTTNFANGGDGTCSPNGIACVTSGDQAGLWYFDDNTAATLMAFAPGSICKGGDFTWTGGQEFDGSVDISGPLTLHNAVGVDGTLNVNNTVDFSADVTITIGGQIDGTHAVMDRVDFSSVGISGDSTVTGAIEFDGAVQVDGSVQVDGLVSFCINNVYDSTWFDVSNAGAYTKTHDLSSTAILTTVYFRDNGNGFGLGANRIYQTTTDYNDGAERGASINNLTTTQVTIQAGDEAAALAWDTNGQLVTCATGQYRVIAMRLV